MRTVFKKSSDADSMKTQIEATEKDIENYGILHDIATIYIGKDVIPELRKTKFKIYKQMIHAMSIIEINNAHAVATYWNYIAEDKTVMKALIKTGGK